MISFEFKLDFCAVATSLGVSAQRPGPLSGGRIPAAHSTQALRVIQTPQLLTRYHRHHAAPHGSTRL